MKTIKINSDRKLNQAYITIGYVGENNIEVIKFEIPKEYEGFSKIACFRTEDGTFTKTFDDLTSNYLTLTSDITQYKEIDMSIEFIDSSNSIIARTSILHITFEDTVNDANDIEPTQPQVVILNELIDEVSKLDITSTKTESGIDVIFTDKQGNKTTRVLANGKDGADGTNGTNGSDGQDGKNATINGVNAINITAGENIELNQENDNLKISANIPENVSPIILEKSDIKELHDLNPRMGENQIFCESLYEKYKDGLFYVNSQFYLSNSTDNVTDTLDFVGVGSIIVVSNMGKSILVFTDGWYYTIKYYKCINTYADSNSKYSLATITSEQLFSLLDDVNDLLRIDNSIEYTPTTSYQPTTKKYVDEKVIAERSIYYAEIFTANWYEKETLQDILDLAYKGGYDDVFIKAKDGTRFITCGGMSLQTLTSSSNTTLMFANLKYITGSTVNPNTIFYGHAFANGVKLDDDGNVLISGETGLKNNSVRVMKDYDLITGYDSTKTQVLKQIKGVLQWVSE